MANMETTTALDNDKEVLFSKPAYNTIDVLNVLKDNYSLLVAQGQVLLIVVNDDCRIEYISSPLCDMLHYPKQVLLNESFFSILDAASNAQVKKAVNSVRGREGKKKTVRDLVLHCIHGVEHYFDGMVINLKNDKRIGGYLFYLHNVSERRKAELKLDELNLELDSFVYKASHDLRAPLTSLAGLINITEMDFPPGAMENFGMMKNSVNKLDKFIRQLANYSRNSNTANQYAEIDFCKMISETIESYRHLKGADKISFEVNISLSDKVISDEFRLQIILNNLISNAIKYHSVNQDFPFVRIAVEREASGILIKVEDNGIGIGDDYVNKIFEMFIRATDSSDGSGLGLFIAKKALEKLSGKIQVVSVLGQGSCFTINLPLISNKPS